MEHVSNKRCPECGSTKVHDTGRWMNKAGIRESGPPPEEPTRPIFVCDECEIRFVTDLPRPALAAV